MHLNKMQGFINKYQSLDYIEIIINCDKVNKHID